MNILKSHFWYKKRQRNGILFLLLFLFILQLFLYFSNNTNEEYLESEEFASLEAKIDSLKKSKLASASSKPYFFNPNYLTDYRAYRMGMSVAEIDKFAAFRNKGRFINSATEFQKITGISDSLLQVMSPLFKFPVRTYKTFVGEASNRKKSTAISVKDLNEVSYQDLLLIPGVDSKLARRILSYRRLIKGYSVNEQLYEVYHLDKAVANNILQYYKVIRLHKIDKIDVNTATFKQLLAMPYIDYELTKKIVNYRDEYTFFKNLEELKKIDSFPLDNFHRIALYLSAE
ncbi:ComEA family DNA-binding protein [Lutimonas sp.]|uniref:ComEA family DNA-binding protein n=1 Tax=Lutimonas sp. TaxID=1872403 RepID=UPI003D9BE6DC